MFERVIIIAALSLYAFVVGCATVGSGGATPIGARIDNTPPTHFPTTQAAGLPYRAIGMQIQRTDWIDRYKLSIDEIADVGADAVKLVVDARQENGGSSRIYLDLRMTPTPDQLAELIQHAHKRNLRVILMPIVLLDKPRGTEWRGKIDPEGPDGWDNWWESYRQMLGHYAWIAEAHQVDVLIIGSELVSTEPQLEEWITTIDQVRRTYKGQITYSANWDHYSAIKFWDRLDLIGMNSYWKLGPNNKVTVEQIEKNWRTIQAELFAFQKKIGKPLFFTEVGWCSMSNMAHEPWDYTKTRSEAPTDLDLQKRLYEGFFQSWHSRPELGGFSIWEWTPGDGGPDDRGYTPENKPAEQVLRQWLSKKW